MIKIATYGCSWTAGVYTNNKETHYACWPKELAKILPSAEIHNYSKGGISNLAILYLFEKMHKNYDINIVKMTCPYRYTFFKDNFEIKIEKQNDNYYSLSRSVDYDILNLTSSGFNPSYVKGFWKNTKINLLWKNLFNVYNEEVADIQSIALAKYFLNQSDFVFCHFHEYLYNFLPSTKNNIKDFDGYIFDNGHHLTNEGAKKEAEWIAKKILTNTKSFSIIKND